MKISHNARFRYALATTLAVSASLSGLPSWADGTPVGVPITNKATATFSDGTTTYDTTSNEVTINVAEVAGIALAAQTPSNQTPIAGSTLSVDFVITNTGNDPTQFFIPGTATLSDATNFSQNGLIQIVAINGTNLPAASVVNVPATGGSTGTLLSTTTSQGSIAAENPITAIPKGTITIRVPIAVNPSAPNTATTTVTIGETTIAGTVTPSATPQTDTRNSDRTGSINATKDLYTVDNPAISAATGETIATPPVNGTREAMATSLPITVGARPQAFPAVLKTVSSYLPGNPNSFTDDQLTYGLALRVDNPATPPAGLTVADLHGTQLVSLSGAGTSPTGRYVLVSDVLPTGLQLAATNPLVATAPNWIPVYSQTPIAGSTALTATWTTARPASGITRVGFIYDTIANPPIAKGTTVSGFSIATTPTATFTGGSIANIAQTFGQSGPGAVVPGTPTQIVYDESGDQTSNNGLDGVNPADPTLPAGGGGITDGIADPTRDGSDPGNNSGTDGGGNGTSPKGGEDTIVSFAATPLNGPAGQPGATGPTGTNNDDFTNKSIVIPAGIGPLMPLKDVETPAKTFDNTVQNTSGGSQVISLVPTAPIAATVPTDLPLPIGTLVTISNATPTTAATITATYRYNGTTFVFDSGTGGTSATVPVRLTIPAGGTANYQTIVDLPGSTADVPVLQFKSYPVPIVAFIDGGSTPNGLPDTAEPSNITIDRLYTNYLQLYKEARMLENDGTPVTGLAGTFGIDQAALSAAATPGRIIEYRITYRNVSSTGGTGSALLPANNLVITENGSAGSNTWGETTLDPKYPAQAIGSAIDSLGTLGSIIVTTGGSPLNITEYKSTVTSVGPGISGTFTFQRQIK
jgi:hypothetical protein